MTGHPLNAYRDLIDVGEGDELRPVEHAFIGDADASEAIYRLLKAARQGRPLEEEVRVTGMKGVPARWLRFRIRPLGDGRQGDQGSHPGLGQEGRGWLAVGHPVRPDARADRPVREEGV